MELNVIGMKTEGYIDDEYIICIYLGNISLSTVKVVPIYDNAVWQISKHILNDMFTFPTQKVEYILDLECPPYIMKICCC